MDEDVVYIYDGILLRHKKRMKYAICSDIEGPRDDKKRHKSDRERQILYDITYMWNLKYNTNEHIYQTYPPDREQTCGFMWGVQRLGSLGLADTNY